MELEILLNRFIIYSDYEDNYVVDALSKRTTLLVSLNAEDKNLKDLGEAFDKTIYG